MTPVDSLIDGNASFAADGFDAALKIMPTKKLMILSCADPRVDPLSIFGLANGDAAVIRNVGGRTGPAVLETMMLLRVSRAGSRRGHWTWLELHHLTSHRLRH